MSDWTIESYGGGSAVPLVDEAASSLEREDVNCAQGFARFIAAGARFNSDDRFNYGQMVTLRLCGQPWFTGRRLLAPRAGGASRQSIEYFFADPWWFLRIPYEQEWADAGRPGFYFKKSRTILCQDIYGHKINTGQQIRAALQFALDNAAALGGEPPFQIGVIEPDADAPWREVNGASCQQVVEMMLAWTPDAAGWLDHSTLPPTIHVVRWANLPIVGLNVPRPVAEIPTLVARHDLKASCVVLHYEIPIETGGEDIISVVTRQYPPGAAGFDWERTVETIDLGGQRASYQTMANTTKRIHPELGSWWKEHLAEFNHPNITIDNIRGSRAHPNAWEDNPAYPITKYPKELTGGSIPDWAGATVAQQTIRALARVKIYTSADKTESKLVTEADVELQTTINITNATTSLYSQLASFEAQEPIPVGLERKMFEAQSVLHYDGDIVLREEWPSMICGVGHRACLNGAAVPDELTTMNSMVQRRRIVVGPGKRSTTILTCGAPHHLSLAQQVDLQRRTRYRLAPINYERVTGKASGRKMNVSFNSPYAQTGSTEAEIYKHVTQEEGSE